jgi:hypothetical protein
MALRNEADRFENAGKLHAVLATPGNLGQSKLTAAEMSGPFGSAPATT